MNVTLAYCVYPSKRTSKQIVVCQRAGLSPGIVLELPEGPRPDQKDQTIHSLSELLEIFP